MSDLQVLLNMGFAVATSRNSKGWFHARAVKDGDVFEADSAKLEDLFSRVTTSIRSKRKEKMPV